MREFIEIFLHIVKAIICIFLAILFAFLMLTIPHILNEKYNDEMYNLLYLVTIPLLVSVMIYIEIKSKD